MTNTIAIWIVIFVIGFFLLDHFYLQLDAGLIVARKLHDLIEFVAFWR